MNFLAKIIRKKLSANNTSKNYRRKRWRRVVSTTLSATLLSTTVGASATTTSTNKVADIDTSEGYINLMANDEFPNATTSRYAGRIWADKTVYSNDTAEIDGRNFTNDSDFLISGSFLGSTRSIIDNQSIPLDVMVVLDQSGSMAYNSRMPHAVDAINTLFNAVRKHNTDSRIGLATYSDTSTSIISLGRHTWGENENVLSVSGTNNYTVTVNNSISTSQRTFQTTGGTYTQRGFYTGMSELAEVTETKAVLEDGREVTRKPVVIMLTDGEPNVFSTNWWAPDANVDNNGYYQGRAASVLGTVMTAAYWKKQIKATYGEEPQVYTVGVDISTNDNVDKFVGAVMDPKANFNNEAGVTGEHPGTNVGYSEAVGYAYNAWKDYVEGNQLHTLYSYGFYNHNVAPVTFGHPDANLNIADLTDINDTNYTTKYYDASSDELGSIFNEIMDSINSNAFYATDESTGGHQSAVVYTDEIGEYMEVKEVKGVLWSGTLYNATKNVDGTYKLTIASGETVPTHPITGNEINIDKMTVRVEKSADGKEKLIAEIPNECLPLRHDKIKVENGVMTSYESSRFETKPLRVLYTVGIQDSIMVDGEVDFTKISEEYIKNNSNSDGTINFYSNLYEGLNNGDVDSGNTTVRFTPAKDNWYYYFQKNRQIFHDEDCTNPVSADELENGNLKEGNYFLKIDYYVSNDFSHGYPEGSHTGYTETIVMRTHEQLSEAVEAINGNVYTKIGAPRVGRLDYFTRKKEQNATGTAEYSFAPEMNTANGEMTVYLGNNGLMTVEDTKEVPVDIGNLKVSKTVISENENDMNENFHFKLTLTDTTINGAFGDMAFVNGVADFTLKHGEEKVATGLPAGVEYTVIEEEANKDDFHTTSPEDTGNIVKGETIEVVFTNTKVIPTPDTGNLTVSKTVANGNNNDKNTLFNFTVTLDDTTINGSFGDMEFKEGVADFTLKDGESKTAIGLFEGIKYTVTEENTEDYIISSENENGVISKDSTSLAKFINTKITQDNLVVSKAVEGNEGDRSEYFSFKVTLDDTSVNGTFGDMEFEDGVATFTLKHGESKVANGLPEGVKYTVIEEEANENGYETSSTNAEGNITKDLISVVFVNTKEVQKPIPGIGSLKVTNTVGGNAGDKNKDFNYVVTLDEPLNGTYGDVTFKDGKASFTLKHGEAKEIIGIPEGTSYTVLESDANQDGYETTSYETEGNIIKNETAVASFINIKNVEEKGIGNLTISNKVEGNDGDKNKEFTFKVTLDDKTINGEFGDVTFKDGEANFTLKDGESVTIKDIPAGVKYKVEESDNEGYTVTQSGEIGDIKKGETVIAQFINRKDIDNGGNGGNNQTPKPNPSNPSQGGNNTSTSNKVVGNTNNNSGTSKSAILTSAIPKTGDEFNISFWMLLMGASFIGITLSFAFLGKGKKEKFNN